jgi:hypothetical protein
MTTHIYLELKRWQAGYAVVAAGDAAVMGAVLVASVALTWLGI